MTGKIFIGIPPITNKFTLDTYPDKSIIKVVQGFISKWSPGDLVMFVGKFGTGKTSLAVSLFKGLINKGGGVKHDFVGKDEDYLPNAWFCDSVELLGAMKANIDRAEKVINIHQRYPLLLLDDLGAERPTPFALECLYRVINYRYNHVLSTIITTNLTPDMLEKEFNASGSLLGGRLVSRLAGWVGDKKVILDGEDLRRTKE